VASTGDQASNVLSATAAANALAMIPDGEGIRAGDRVRVMLMDTPADH
jgi:molybdopterin biosynthesis enzyme